MKRLLAFMLALAREISDENAYARHLAKTGRVRSDEEWRAFMDRRLRQKYQSAKCC